MRVDAEQLGMKPSRSFGKAQPTPTREWCADPGLPPSTLSGGAPSCAMRRPGLSAGHVDRPPCPFDRVELLTPWRGLLDCPRVRVVQDPERMLREPCACLWSTPIWVRTKGAMIAPPGPGTRRPVRAALPVRIRALAWIPDPFPHSRTEVQGAGS